MCDTALPSRAVRILSDAGARSIYDEVFGPALAILYPDQIPFFAYAAGPAADQASDYDRNMRVRAALDAVCCPAAEQCWYPTPLAKPQA
ncbi:hypothetical protein P8C59_006498 [Phyllachora maydis]|uniref:Uncharacterized protein n=1 Tax=Phyllachora maydis TaxID=1825666 RepID=A0AAD9MFK4_9PEZI|nr:hypothetical protein P8C59_006498 [Phyllachora maydis]